MSRYTEWSQGQKAAELVRRGFRRIPGDGYTIARLQKKLPDSRWSEWQVYRHIKPEVWALLPELEPDSPYFTAGEVEQTP